MKIDSFSAFRLVSSALGGSNRVLRITTMIFCHFFISYAQSKNAFIFSAKISSQHCGIFSSSNAILVFLYVLSERMISWRYNGPKKSLKFYFYLHIEVFSVFVFVISKY